MSKVKLFGMLLGALFLAAPVFAFAYYNGASTLDVYVQVQNQNNNCWCNNNFNGNSYNNCCNNNYSNNYWGSNSPSDFQISVSGNSASPQNFRGNENGTYVSLAPGYYSVNPQNVSGWSYSTSGNCSGTLGSGQTLSCTVTYFPTNGSYQNCNQYNNSNCYPYQNCNYNNSGNCYPNQNCTGYNNGYCNNQYPYQNAPLSCYPSAQTVALGATAVFSATGGTGFYTWSSGGHVYSGSGATLNAQFYNPGPQTVEVQSDGQTAYCSVNAVGSAYPVSTVYPSYPSTPSYTVVPALPNTGFAPNGWIEYALAVLLFGLAGVLAYPYVRNALAYIRG